ncbi:MAG: calcium/sodium antiporter, partial [Actinomycetota bacterium]
MTIATPIFLVVGIVALVIGAEGLVRGAARLAARTGMSSVVIGLTVVAFGTSAPELAVSIGDVLRGGDEAGAIAVGNVVGSNIANILLVLGIAATVGGSLLVAQRIVRLDVPIMIGASVLVWLFVLNEALGRLEGIVLTVMLVVYITWTVVKARGTSDDVSTEYDEALAPEKLRESSVWADILFVAVGLGFLVLGSQSLVSAASDIAGELGVSDLVIGLTVVAVGTSLPEIATSVLAAMRGQRDLAVGNAIGSNLFNLLAVLGITAAVAPNPLPVAESAVRVDFPVMIAVAIACLPVFAHGYVLNRWEGIVFVLMYAGHRAVLVAECVLRRIEHEPHDVA